MMRVPHLRPASHTAIVPGTVMAALFCACFGLIPPASAQTFTARSFKCGKDEARVIGQSGRAVELAARC